MVWRMLLRANIIDALKEALKRRIQFVQLIRFYYMVNGKCHETEGFSVSNLKHTNKMYNQR